MNTESYQMGIVGLGVMGSNLALNVADHGFPIAVFNRTASVTDAFIFRSAAGKPIKPFYSLAELVAALDKPRPVLLMVEAGNPVDQIIAQLEKLLEPGDMIIDGGNAYFKDTERREKALAEKGIQYLGVGISGGERGARYGPSIMPGGSRDAYQRVKAILEAIAARVQGEP